ncbi:MAG TPA: proprotein convertase P-domain-containing protein [Kofleriaceae bacterium]
MRVIHEDAHDVSPPLDELIKMSIPAVAGRAHEAEPWRRIPHAQLQSAGLVTDPVVQTAIGAPLIPATSTSFEGAGTGLAGFTVNVAPPDIDGDVGPNHYVQIVNSSVTIFNKTGGIVKGPFTTQSLFANFNNNACQNTNDGDGVVRYDRNADRWVIAQFSVNGGNGPFFQCIAVSTSPDPTGTFNRYQFSFASFNDYPKMGLWREAYTFTYNLFSTTAFLGADVCAADRATMLAGGTATQVCFTTSNQFGGLLAADSDGPNLPPACEPQPILTFGTNVLDVWKLQSGFGGCPAASLTGPTAISVAAFTPLCNGGTCVVQPGTTNQLDSLADRPMNRLVYRNFTDHEALLVTHSVTAGTGGGIRWYELRNTAGTPTVFQQGTYAPDSAFRWMSSATFDGSGDIGMGFSISSSAINPSVRYTGRLVGDALGTMGQGEGTIVSGTGSQTGNLTRWGDYSSMNIDPSDDCTFWYTQEYMGASGSFNWRTRIGSFKFPNCGATPPANDFSISVTPASQSVNAGSSVSYSVTTAVTAGAAQTVNLTVTGLPSGVTGSFSPASVTAGGSSTLTLTAASTAPSATATFTVTGTGTSATHTASAQVTVVNGAGCINGTFTSTNVPLSIPDNNATGITSNNVVTGNGTVGSLSLSLNITHTFRGDLVVTLIAPDGTQFIVSNRAGGSADNIIITNQAITAFNGHTAAGTWKLKVQDLAAADVGTLNSWSLTIVGNCGAACINGTFNSTNVPQSIPDNNATGITSTNVVTGNGTVGSLSLSLNITHTFIGDLVVTLVAPDGTSFIVSNRAGGATQNLVITNQAITAFNGHTAAGTWQLKVQDLAAVDVGTLNSWSLNIVGSCP